jgi:hypothetical protein
MVRHIFLWKVAPGEDLQEIIDTLNTLPEKCPGIVGWEIGDHQAEPNPNGDPWDGALISDHESWESLDEYSNHPYHTEVVEKLLPKFAERAVVDFVRVQS